VSERKDKQAMKEQAAAVYRCLALTVEEA